MAKLTQFVLRHRRLVALVWLAAWIVGGYASSILSSHLSQSFEIPGTHSDIADSAIIAHYRSGGAEQPLVPVIVLPAGRTAQQTASRADLQAGFAAVARLDDPSGTGRVVSFASTGNPGFVSADGRTTFGLVFTPTNGNPLQDPHVSVAAIRAALLHSLPPGAQVEVTGIAPLTSAGGSSTGPGVLDEILIGGLG